jgi:hypothetical protein
VSINTGNWRWLDAISISAAFAYLCAVMYLNVSAPLPMTPDELWFAGVAIDSTWTKAYFGFELAYGGLFWIFLKSLLSVAGYQVTKAVFLAALLSPLLYAVLRLRGYHRALAVLLWIGMPMAWWYGKVISPDTLTVALVCASVLLLINGKERSSFVFVGLAVGVKITSLALLPALAFLASAQNKKQLLSRVPIAITLTACAAIVANPSFLLDPSAAFNAIAGFGAPTPPSWDTLQNALFGSTKTWDLIYTHSLLKYDLVTAGYLVLLAAATWLNPKAGLATACAFLATAILLAKSRLPFIWYWFPMLTMCYLIFVTPSSKRSYIASAFQTIGAILVALGSYPSHAEQVRLLIAAREHTTFALSNPQCISEVVKEFEPRGDVYIRSFTTVERAISSLFPGEVKEAQYTESVGESQRLNATKGTYLVDSEVVRAGLYPALSGAPTICEGRFYVHAMAAER